MQREMDDVAILIALLDWQVEMGVTEAIAETPQNRFEALERSPAEPPAAAKGAEPERAPAAAPPTGPPAAPIAAAFAAAGTAATGENSAATLASAAMSLDALAAAMEAWEGCDLRHGARRFVFADGRPGARLMIVGEAPGSEEDRQGKPFVGRAGQLLDRMLGAIGLARDAADLTEAAYITNILPWRPPGNRTSSEAEVQAFLPFVERHIALAEPDVLLALGGTSAKALLGTTTAIKRLRGHWVRHGATGHPLLPSFHPAYLLRQPGDKRLAWRDLQAVRAALDGAAPMPET